MTASDRKDNVTEAAKSAVRGVQSIEVGAKLLSVLADEATPLMLRDLAHLAGMAPAQAHAYLVSYRKIGMVEQDEDTGHYRLGRFALDIGITRMQTSDPFQLAYEALGALSDQIGVTVATVVWGTFGPTVIQLRENGDQLNMRTRPGTVYSLSGTASGRVFSAFMQEATIRDVAKVEKRAADGARVGVSNYLSRRDLDKIRADGYSGIDPHPVPGVAAFAAPVFDSTGQMAMAMTIIGPARLFAEKAQESYVPALLAATGRLSAELGYSPAIRAVYAPMI